MELKPKKSARGINVRTFPCILPIIAMLLPFFFYHPPEPQQEELVESDIESRVDDTHMDLRTLATAIEAYNIDNRTYPAHSLRVEETINFIHALKHPEADWKTPSFMIWSADKQVASLTTPIQYLLNYGTDLFGVPAERELNYWGGSNGWILWSCGPDRISDIREDEYDFFAATFEQDYTEPRILELTQKLLPKTYDPTNGIDSGGDIWRIKL